MHSRVGSGRVIFQSGLNDIFNRGSITDDDDDESGVIVKCSIWRMIGEALKYSRVIFKL